jgi:hypothetical protein
MGLQIYWLQMLLVLRLALMPAVVRELTVLAQGQPVSAVVQKLAVLAQGQQGQQGPAVVQKLAVLVQGQQA